MPDDQRHWKHPSFLQFQQDKEPEAMAATVLVAQAVVVVAEAVVAVAEAVVAVAAIAPIALKEGCGVVAVAAAAAAEAEHVVVEEHH